MPNLEFFFCLKMNRTAIFLAEININEIFCGIGWF